MYFDVVCTLGRLDQHLGVFIPDWSFHAMFHDTVWANEALLVHSCSSDEEPALGLGGAP